MSISLQEFERRYAAIRKAMEKERLDCLLVVGLNDDFNRGNIRYVTGLGRGGCCILPLEGKPGFSCKLCPDGFSKTAQVHGRR